MQYYVGVGGANVKWHFLRKSLIIPQVFLMRGHKNYVLRKMSMVDSYDDGNKLYAFPVTLKALLTAPGVDDKPVVNPCHCLYNGAVGN
jgi:hypothetical protein